MSAMPAETVRVVRSPEAAASVLDPVRLRLVRELKSPASASELSRRLGQPRQRLNYHLRELEKAGLVRLVEERRRGNCTERIVQAVATAYLVSPEALGAISADPSRIADRASSAYLVAVAGQTIREVAVLRERAELAGKQLPTLTAQAEVRLDSAAAMNAFAEDLRGAVAAVVARHDARELAEGGGRLFRVNVGCYPAITRDEAATVEQEARW